MRLSKKSMLQYQAAKEVALRQRVPKLQKQNVLNEQKGLRMSDDKAGTFHNIDVAGFSRNVGISLPMHQRIIRKETMAVLLPLRKLTSRWGGTKGKPQRCLVDRKSGVTGTGPSCAGRAKPASNYQAFKNPVLNSLQNNRPCDVKIGAL